MEILYHVPNIRVGLLVKTMQWMMYGFDYLRNYNTKAEDAAKNSKIDLENFHKEF